LDSHRVTGKLSRSRITNSRASLAASAFVSICNQGLESLPTFVFQMSGDI
jgi:hypothetical protein